MRTSYRRPIPRAIELASWLCIVRWGVIIAALLAAVGLAGVLVIIAALLNALR